MLYECLFKDGAFLIAKPKGWAWSERECDPAVFVMHETLDLKPAEADFDVELPAGTVKASRIDPRLIERKVIPWPI